VKHALQNTSYFSSFLTALNCTKFFSAGALLRIPLKELTALFQLHGLRGSTFKRGKGRMRKRRVGKGRREERKGRE